MLIILHGGQIVCTVTSQQEALKILALSPCTCVHIASSLSFLPHYKNLDPFIKTVVKC